MSLGAQSDEHSKLWLRRSEELLQLIQQEMKRKERKINYLENHVDDFPSYSTKLLFKDVKHSLDSRKAEFIEFETFVANMRALDDKFDAIVNDFDGAATLNAMNAMKDQTINKQRESFSRQVLLNSQTVRDAVSTLQVNTARFQKSSNGNNSSFNDCETPVHSITYEDYPQTVTRSSFEKDGNYEDYPSYIKVEQESPPENSSYNDGDESVDQMSHDIQNISTVDVMFTPQSQFDEDPVPTQNHKTKGGKKTTVVCCICSATKQYVTPRKRFGKSTCDSCFFFFWRFTRKPRQLYCRHQGICKIEGQKRNSINRCLACWLSTCLDKFELSEKLRNFITSKYPPKIQMVQSQNKANHVYKVRRLQAY